MKLYNTLTRTKEDFVPLDGTHIKMYTCGPTVYNYFHIGNARCFTLFDMLRRYLEYRGYDVTFVQNFTDIDDKIIKRSIEEKIPATEVAKKYIEEYFIDAKGLGIHPATIHPKATENIDEILAIIGTLIEKGYAYPRNGDVYFRTKSFAPYGKLSHMPIDDLESGARVDITEEKEDPLDFALWKAAKPEEPKWESPWGEGRPGWHIECSAMVRRYLGDTIDIHCGGQDLSFPHHENEIAQSEAATGKPFANYWVHNGYINVDNRKMSKSLHNFFTVREVAEKYGYSSIRFFVLSSQYRSPVNFSEEIMEQSKSALERIYNCADTLQFYLANTAESPLLAEEEGLKSAFEKRKVQFIEAMDDDFNTADGISVIFELAKDCNLLINQEKKPSSALVAYAQSIFTELTQLMGFVREEQKNDTLEAEIKEWIEKRFAAKKAKNYAEADRIRTDLLARGIVLEDTPQGTKFRIR